MSKYWTKDEKAELEKLWNENKLTCSELAGRFRTSKSSVTGQAYRMNLPKKHDWGNGRPRFLGVAECRPRFLGVAESRPVRKGWEGPTMVDSRGVTLPKLKCLSDA